MKPLTIAVCILLVDLYCQATSTDELSKHVVLQRSLGPDNSLIVAFDSLLSKEVFSSLRKYVINGIRWEVADRDRDAESCHRSLEEVTECQDTASPDLPWVGKLDPSWFSQTNTWRTLKEAVNFATNQSDPEVFPYLIRSEVLQRGDNVAPTAVVSSSYTREFALRVFLVSDWRNDDYGDMSFYVPAVQNKTKGSRFDIAATVRPHPGRVVLWDASIPTLYRPPSMGYLQKLTSVSIQLTTSREKFEAACQEWKDWDELKTQQLLAPFPEVADSVEQLDMDKHLTREYTDNEGRKVKIYDGVFDEDHLATLREYLVASPSSASQGYDLEEYEQSDNVRWIKMFDPFEFPKSSAWGVLSQVTRHATGGKQDWFPYDVSVNVVRSGDHTRVHEDCEDYEEERTMVTYLNPDLGPGDYGETVYYNTKPHDEFEEKLYEGVSRWGYDAFAAVTPKYGRVVIFPGQIPHSARPPSTGYTKPRYSFAVKVSANRKAAITKRLREIIEDEGMEEKALYHEIVRMQENGLEMNQSEEWLENKYKGFILKLEQEKEEVIQSLRKVL